MNEYVRVSNALYHEFETAANNNQECEVVYLNDDNKVSIKSKILKFKNINGTEYMDVKDGVTIRLDKIITFNGESTKNLNHYL